VWFVRNPGIVPVSCLALSLQNLTDPAIPAIQDREPAGRACQSSVSGSAGLLMFGGAVFCGRMPVPDSAVWRWSGQKWVPWGPHFSGRREDALLAFDDRRQMLILYGGRAGDSVYSDTWESNGTSWRRTSSGGAPSPGAVEHAAAAFDQRRGRMVVFGGGSRTGRQPVNHVWEWDGTVWEQRTADGPVPAARIGAAVAYDGIADHIVLFGGAYPNTPPSDETWIFAAGTWRRARPAP
jgi:hypothetical protein